MYQVKVNEKFDFKIDVVKNQLTVNDEVVVLDRKKVRNNTNHVIYQHQSYTVEVVQLDSIEKTAIVKVNGKTYALNIKDQFDQLLKQLGMDNLATAKISYVKAPMPGLVLNILAKEGDEMKKGDNILVLEAMKMENMIKSPTDGIIKKIAIKQGDKVEKNELLITFE